MVKDFLPTQGLHFSGNYQRVFPVHTGYLQISLHSTGKKNFDGRKKGGSEKRIYFICFCDDHWIGDRNFSQKSSIGFDHWIGYWAIEFEFGKKEIVQSREFKVESSKFY